MDVEILRLAAAPTTRSLVRELAERLRDADPCMLAEEARADGELRAAVNLALAGAISGRPPTGTLVADIYPSMENSDLGIALFGSVKRGLLEGLLASSRHGWHSALRLGFILRLATLRLDGRDPPDELKTRIRLTSRHELCTGDGAILLGLAAMAVDDPDVTEVARDCVEAADSAVGRSLDRRFRKLLEQPLIDVIPEEAPDLHAGFTVKRTTPRVGRNEPCPCGSGKKYKQCCLNRAAETAPTANPGQPWGERARQHRTMSDRQFSRLLPIELARIPPEELPTPRLVQALQTLRDLQAVDQMLPFVEEAAVRTDLPGDSTPQSIREDALQSAIATRDLDLVDILLEGIDNPDALREEIRIGLAIIRHDADVLDRIEAMADRALREEDEEVLARFIGLALWFSPALGILLIRGDMDVDDPVGMENALAMIEEARDKLLLPPHDRLWEIYDAVSEQMLEARAERSAVEENADLAAELEEVRSALAISRSSVRDSRREIDRQTRKVDDLAAAVVAAKESARGPADANEALEDARRELQSKRLQIAEGNEKQRQLRDRIRRLGARLDAAPAEEVDADDDLEIEPERERTERLTPRLPVFSKEFRDGLESVADYVARAATAAACLLAAADAGTWSGVKSIKALPEVFSRRIGRHRLLFRLEGEDGIEMLRVIHRRDLETVIRKMGG